MGIRNKHDRRYGCTFLVVVVVLATYGSAIAFVITFRAYVDKAVVLTGDTITYSVEVDPTVGIDLQFPAYNTGNDNLTILDEAMHQGGFVIKSTIKRYKLRSYTPGTYKLPPATVKYKSQSTRDYTEAKTNEVTIEVKSAREKTPATDIRDIKDLQDSKVPWPYIIAGALTLLIAALALYLLRRRRAAKQAPPPRKTPHEMAYEALERLRAGTLLQDGLIKEYFIELSAIIRYYIEDRFLLKAPEMTTEEFLFNVKEARQLSVSQKELLRDFLLRCDMVKFARYGPAPEEIEESFNVARRFVDETRPLQQSAPETKDA
ncbi:MAG: BatD family protein [Candidatus Magnetobacterium sp. LHC-1]|nr:hypothetical protein [Nitrospirota bacterium]